jgi:serine/threonine protein kinase
MADSGPKIPEFSIRAKIAQFNTSKGGTWDETFEKSPGGRFGRAVRATWRPPQGGLVQVILKVLLGARNAASARPDETTRDGFDSEVDILQKVRAIAAHWASEVGRSGAPAPHFIGLRHLSFTYCTGWEEDASIVLRTHALPGSPLFFIAMEPLDGGSLWERQHLNPIPRPGSAAVWTGRPLPPEEALRAAADLMAGLAALHKLGYAHADLK